MRTRSRPRWRVTALLSTAALVLAAGCGTDDDVADTEGDEAVASSDGGEVTLEFAQWWEPELPEGSLRELMDRFEDENPGVTVELLSGPYASTRDQIVTGSAAGTMSDVVGLDGAWIHDFAQQGSLADLSALMSDAGYDDSQLASQVQVAGSTYMIPVVNYIYPLFINEDILSEAGVDAAPSTRSEFTEAAVAVSELSGTSGWVLPLSLETPNGIQNDVMAWVWASGGTMLADGQPDLTNPEVESAVTFIKDLWDRGVVAPGAFTLQEPDKVEEFMAGRVGMIISSLAHINLIREQNPDLEFSLAAIPAEDGYTGERGLPYASWGVGVAENSEHKEAAWALVDFLMSEEVNAELSTMANAFPGNSTAVPDFVAGDDLFEKAFEIYSDGYPENEFVGLPVAEQLMRSFSEQFQLMLEGDQSVDEALEAAQEAWEREF